MKKRILAVVAMLLVPISMILTPSVAQGAEVLSPTITVGGELFDASIGATPFKEPDVYYDYPTVATVNGEWGANVFYGNDDNKVFAKVVPADSQWRVYGFTSRKDGWYYDVGGDMWLQASQAKVPVADAYDALLNTEAFLSGKGTLDVYHIILVDDEYGVHYKVSRVSYSFIPDGPAPGYGPIFQDDVFYNVYKDGQVYSMGPDINDLS